MCILIGFVLVLVLLLLLQKLNWKHPGGFSVPALASIMQLRSFACFFFFFLLGPGFLPLSGMLLEVITFYDFRCYIVLISFLSECQNLCEKVWL